MAVGVRAGLQLEEFAAEGGSVDVEGAVGWGAVGEGEGEEGVEGWGGGLGGGGLGGGGVADCCRVN